MVQDQDLHWDAMQCLPGFFSLLLKSDSEYKDSPQCPPPQGITTNKEYENKLPYLKEVHQMVILVVGTDVSEEDLERSLHPLGQCPVTHVKS